MNTFMTSYRRVQTLSRERAWLKALVSHGQPFGRQFKHFKNKELILQVSERKATIWKREIFFFLKIFLSNSTFQSTLIQILTLPNLMLNMAWKRIIQRLHFIWHQVKRQPKDDLNVTSLPVHKVVST